MSKGNRNRKNRNCKTIEHYDGYTITRWIDEKAGNTPEERFAYWERTSDERRARGELNTGLGFVVRNPFDGEVLDYTFDDLDAAIDYEIQKVLGCKEVPFTNPPVIDSDMPKIIRMPSLGIGVVNLEHPNAERFVTAAVKLIYTMRAGEITEFEAIAKAHLLYCVLGMDEMPDAA